MTESSEPPVTGGDDMSPAQRRIARSWTVRVSGPGLNPTLPQCHRDTREEAEQVAADLGARFPERTYTVEPPRSPR